MKNQKLHDKFIELRSQGNSYHTIAEKLGVSKQTLIRWSKLYEVQISNLRVLELDALQRKYFLTKESKIEAMGKVLKSVITEIEKRDFSDVSSEKLIEIFLKVSDASAKEKVDITLSEKCQSPMNIGSSMLRNNVERWPA